MRERHALVAAREIELQGANPLTPFQYLEKWAPRGELRMNGAAALNLAIQEMPDEEHAQPEFGDGVEGLPDQVQDFLQVANFMPVSVRTN